jgi:hypothetical protein
MDISFFQQGMEGSGQLHVDRVPWTWAAEHYTLEDEGAAFFSAGDGQEGVDKKVRLEGRESWASGESLQSAGKVVHTP